MEIPNINDVDLAFGNIKHMPEYSTIPKEFKDGQTKWNKLFSTLFFKGATGLKLTGKNGVDEEKAFKAISAIMKSWEPKHEHKEAACAYLFDQWFEDYEIN